MRPSLRWRLTAIYGGLFFAAGGLLLAINWGLVRGWNTPYPKPRNAVFGPLSLDLDDDEREEEEEER